jgi:hypothetical protein
MMMKHSKISLSSYLFFAALTLFSAKIFAQKIQQSPSEMGDGITYFANNDPDSNKMETADFLIKRGKPPLPSFRN